nr:hypothetical protein [uncultured Psychroserpens sp.]
MKIKVLTILILVLISCRNVTKKETEQVEIIIDSTELKIETSKKQTENIKLNSFLENPIDLQGFKTLKNINYTTTGVSNGMEYHLNPKFKDSIFYNYNYPTVNFKNYKKTNRVLVFKYGKNKHTYDDKTEILIELSIFNKDSDLGKANLVGLSQTELESEFGADYLTLENRIIYSHKNKVLIIELKNSRVKSFNYIKLNTENIESDLIRKIVK